MFTASLSLNQTLAARNASEIAYKNPKPPARTLVFLPPLDQGLSHQAASRSSVLPPSSHQRRRVNPSTSINKPLPSPPSLRVEPYFFHPFISTHPTSLASHSIRASIPPDPCWYRIDVSEPTIRPAKPRLLRCRRGSTLPFVGAPSTGSITHLSSASLYPHPFYP